LLLLLFSVSINSVCSFCVHKTSHKKTIAYTGVLVNLIILAFFKYSPLVSITFFDPKDPVSSFLINIPLPIGISFYTFEGISLLVDVYKNNSNENKIVNKYFPTHFRNSFLFIVFFPHLVAGPILKADSFFSQIEEKVLSKVDFNLVFRYLVVGYFLKMVIADNLKEFTFWIEYPYFQSQSSLILLTMLFGYSCQIFADFAGYSLIALGLAALFGYKLEKNFNFPYIASSFQDFWKRWHISLSSFLQKYLYVNLGGNRKGKFRTYLNLLLTMVIGGLWHGAAWSYAVWGGFHGILLVLERMLLITKFENIFYKISKLFFVFTCVTFGWLLFKLTNFNHAVLYLKNILSNYYLLLNWQIFINVLIYCFPIFLYHLIYLIKTYRNNTYQLIIKFEFAILGLMLFFLFTNSGLSGSFIYFQF